MNDRSRKWVIGLVIVAAFLLAHPYTGIRHDGILYLGDALRRLDPASFQDDLYFLYGSQGRFTLLPAAYAALISVFGIGDGTIVGMVVASALYLAATWFFLASFAPAASRPFCMLSVLLGWTLYGGTRTFAYSENFLTARSFAEPAVLLALAFLLRNRLIAAGTALLVALLIHPLIAAGGVLIAWLYLVAADRRWLIAGAAALVGFVALSVAGVGPFADVFARYDSAWLQLLHEVNPQAFVAEWSPSDMGILAYDTVVLCFATRQMANKPSRTLLLSALVAGLAAVAASYVLVDLLKNPFFGKIQVWRAEWVMQWLAMASLPMTLASLWKEGERERVVASFLAIGWIAAFTLVPAPLALMAVAIFALRRHFVISSTTTRIVGGLVVVAGLIVFVQHLIRAIGVGVTLDQAPRAIVSQALATNVALFVVAGSFIHYAAHQGRKALVVAMLAVVIAATLWEQRTPWQREMEASAPGSTIWPGVIQPKEKVYWYRDLIAPWILLGHGNYYTQQQGSGAVFSREMVVELDRRRHVTQILDFQEQICRLMNTLNEKQGACEPDTDAVRNVCTDGQIDFVVLQTSLQGAPPVQTYSTGVVENGYEKKFFLYRCSAL